MYTSYLKLFQVVRVKKKKKSAYHFLCHLDLVFWVFPFYLIFFVIGDNLSEAGAGSALHSDTSNQPTVAYSSDQIMGSQMVSNLPQTEINVLEKIYPSQQLVGHYQQISGVRWTVKLLNISSVYLLENLSLIFLFLFNSCRSSQSWLSPKFCLWFKVGPLFCLYMSLDLQLSHNPRFRL